jgi:hypothetical protein
VEWFKVISPTLPPKKLSHAGAEAAERAKAWILTWVVTLPFSAFSEALRGMV